MKKIYMYAHGGSGNHGCEAIVRSTLKVLKDIDCEKILISSTPQEDIKYGIDSLCTIMVDKQPYSKINFDFFKAYFALKIKHNYIEMDKLPYLKTIAEVQKGDIAMSIGGDNYCYADVDKYIMLHDMFLKRGAKTVLWGCSIEPNLVEEPKIKADLERYSLITARETISYEALKKVNKNTILVSDTAFSLDTKETSVDKLNGNNMVGINISPMIIKNEVKSGMVIKNYEGLIKYILDETDMSVSLIPHVIWERNDDRIPLKALYEKFKDSGRVFLVEDMDCESIKGVISNCRFFVGARTHSTIAAYSSCVPTIVVGYSIKARGIAKDLFGSDKYIVPVQDLNDEEMLLEEFKKILEEEEIVKDKLKLEMSEYIKNSEIGVKYIKEL